MSCHAGCTYQPYRKRARTFLRVVPDVNTRRPAPTDGRDSLESKLPAGAQVPRRRLLLGRVLRGLTIAVGFAIIGAGLTVGTFYAILHDTQIEDQVQNK